MKNIYALFLLILVFNTGFCQERYEKEIEEISKSLNTQLTTPSIKDRFKENSKNLNYKVALVSIENEDGTKTRFTDLLENEIAINLAISSNGAYTILDRNFIDKLTTEKNIPKYAGNKIDFAKNIGRIKAANLIVVGIVNRFEDNFRVLFTIVETSEGLTVGGSRGTITATPLIIDKNNKSEDKIIKYSAPITSNRNAAIPDQGCQTTDGKPSIRFVNKTGKDIELKFFTGNKNSNPYATGLGLDPEEFVNYNIPSGDFKDISLNASGTYKYRAYIKKNIFDDRVNDINGSVVGVDCKQTTEIIK